MKLSDKLYDILKWVDLVCLPAITTFYVVCAPIWGWPYASEIAKTSAAFCTLLGAILFGVAYSALLGISTAEYRKSKGAHEK